ncbi:helix-turn-helix domain-containing protein [Actinomadura latina]|uniref:Helix-turn-helix domain-containing protein n=1 Tax=Actinomadura latina TaxID=163603 RepID=A0A846Z1R6_9ACTN|nr:helix-turn-helix transcriptional regulator [Actinomadura latina]NKZ06839.1 helix-turn-helix domain-containing protein [Actinomadura latina]
MASKKPLTPVAGTAALAYWGGELRYYREQVGYTQDRFAQMIYVSSSLIAMVETGKRTPKPSFIKDCDQALDTGGALARLWKRLIESSYLEWFRPVVEIESDAVAMIKYEAQAVPGLLQTEEYARALLRTGPARASDAKIEQHVAARMNRQHVLTKDAPPLLWAIMDENVLRRPVGGTKVMCNQFAWLVEAAKSPDVILQVLPFAAGAHAGINGSMTLFSLPDQGDVVYAAGFGGGQIIGCPEQVDECRLALDLLRACAFSPEDSIRMIAGLIGES